MFVIRRGTIQLSTENNRGYSIVTDHGEGDFFGEELLLGRGQSPYRAIALADCELHLLDRSDLDELMAQAPGILVEIMRRVAQRLRLKSRLCRDRSHRNMATDPTMKPASLGTRAVRSLTSPVGTRLTVVIFLIALGAWSHFGHQGIPWLRLEASDSMAPTLTMVLKVLSAFAIPAFLLVLLRIARQGDRAATSQINLLEKF
jgi:hypothetical protein